MNVLNAVARVAVGVPFIWLGYDAVSEPGMRVQMAEDFGVPGEYAELSAKANGAVMVAGGAMVALGILPRWGALAVAGAMVPTTLAGHSFWTDEDPGKAKQNRIQFLKNVGMIGGLLVVAATSGRAAE